MYYNEKVNLAFAKYIKRKGVIYVKFSDFMMAIHACDVDLPTYMTPNNFTAAKEEFLANPELSMPNFTYDNYDFTEELAKLSEIEKELLATSSDLHPAQAKIVTEYIANVKTKLTDLMAMQQYRDQRSLNASPASLAALRKSIEDMNATLNSLPEPETYRYLLEHPTAEHTNFVPKPETIQKFGELLNQKWAKSFARIDTTKEEYSPQEVCDLVNTIIQEDFGFETSFRARVDEKKTCMNVDQINRVLDIPLRRSSGKYTPSTLRKIVLGHETFGHLYRAAFMQAKHPEIGIPLPGYITFEEGVTKCIEQALGGEYELAGAESYVICGIAFCDKMTFREAFDRYCEYICIRGASSALSEKTISVLFSRTVRAFRGTGDIPWSGSTVYFNGPEKVWPFIERHIDDPEFLWKMLFESGKTDPTLSSHQKLVELYEE